MEERDYQHTKESIKQRMYNHAANFWGANSTESLDPVVVFLMEGLAAELFNVINEAKDSNSRILESIAEFLTPSELISPRPAHTIAKADPLEPTLYVDKFTEFHDKNTQHEELENMSFVPLTKVRLTAVKINYLVCERMLYRKELDGRKKLLTQATKLDERVNNTVWIGLEIDEEIESLQNVSFYIDFPNSVNKYEKYSLLSYSKWSHDEKLISMFSGLPDWESSDLRKQNDTIFHSFEIQNQIDENIKQIYKPQFLTIADEIMQWDMIQEQFPSMIRDMFPDHIVSTFKPCYWLKITLPPHLMGVDLHDMNVEINAFPILNKIPLKANNSSKNLMDSLISLRTSKHEKFFSVERVIDSHGHEYKSIPYTTDENTTGTYSIKQRGVERFDKRQAKVFMETLIDLLRSESVAFASMEMDNLQNIISKIEQNMSDLENKQKKSHMTGLEIPHYILLKTINPNDTVYVDFWATNCELANGLRPGKTLTPVNFVTIANCTLLKISSGGKSAPNIGGKLNAYRYAMGAHGSILTNEDIARFVTMELAEKVLNVEAKKGVAVSNKPKEGLIRTIDIHVSPASGYETIVRDMEPEIMTLLRSRSPSLFNFRMIINSEQ